MALKIKRLAELAVQEPEGEMPELRESEPKAPQYALVEWAAPL